MACTSCAERRALALQALRNVAAHRPIAPQVQAFNTSIARDFRGMVTPMVAAMQARMGPRR